ncbi:Protein farnesyltransferase/geranylgeranyltransferase type-1 subunit alpha [Golovinomyces cichoracearum]|uniref:Protein farnesyltransferase/geranylgeranyltransferase type-1 subunit alpha n=1 Tax=Golovinomyces cichoracearum TaxID=62708 RepID=A0A420HU99_9PEZI|nr:Protein farnesyltransferase/geranylgeranyltransferase type-1 subunit alpha [Golovinomyces cichoracearum]
MPSNKVNSDGLLTPSTTEKPKEYNTIAAQLEASYIESTPYHSNSILELTSSQKLVYILSGILDSGIWHSWDSAKRNELWKLIEANKVPIPAPKPGDLGKDSRGRSLCQLSPKEFFEYKNTERELSSLRAESTRFKEMVDKEEADIEMEKNRRKLIGILSRKNTGKYEGNPEWDDVIPIPQEDGEGALASITYTEEYSEAMSYLRAIIAAKEQSIRVLTLTAHIINLNPAHYTVWLYRASTIITLNMSITAELEWVNQVALQNQKNYQIWHHRQLLIDHLYPSIVDDLSAKNQLTSSESAFIQKMLDEDSKNYHVWSYRQYLIRKFNLFNPSELLSVETLIKRDVMNNSAWSHRFFLVFSNPEYASASATAIDYDPCIPGEIIEREKSFAKFSTLEAPQNPCPWNYLRGVLRKSGQTAACEEDWAAQFVTLGETGNSECKLVKSSHALEFLTDAWAEKGEFIKVDEAYRLLGERYDPIRKIFWEWKRANQKPD